jgi:hypothetical protein
VDCGKEEHEDEKLSGTFSDAGPVPEAPATGAVKGNKVVFGWYVKESRTSYTAVFKGAIESASDSSVCPSHSSSCANLSRMSSSVKPPRWDCSPGVLFRLPLQIFRRVCEKTKEDCSAHCDNDATHLASLIAALSASGRNK